MQRVDQVTTQPTPFLTGPAEFLCQTIAEEMAKVKQWKAVFGEFIDSYKRMDYGIRNLPALRIYNNTSSKQSDNGWINGEVLVDAIMPASLRRVELQQVPDVITGALWQQFRRDQFFQTIRGRVPGLNELGRVLSVDKGLGWQPADGEEIVPLTQFTLNFKLDLRIWDDYLTEQLRTNEDPFDRTLANLELIALTIRGVSSDTPAEELSSDIKV